MYRRIENILKAETIIIRGRKHKLPGGKYGVMSGGPDPQIFDNPYWVALAELPVPRESFRKNCKFYFTELGWDKFGRRMIHGLLQSKCQFMVITIKENAMEVMYKDKYQVAVRPRKK